MQGLGTRCAGRALADTIAKVINETSQGSAGCASWKVHYSSALQLAANCHLGIQRMFDIEPGPEGRRGMIIDDFRDGLKYLLHYRAQINDLGARQERCTRDPRHMLETAVVSALIDIHEEALEIAKNSATFRKLKRYRYNQLRTLRFLAEGSLTDATFEMLYCIKRNTGNRYNVVPEVNALSEYGVTSDTLVWTLGLPIIVAHRRGLPEHAWKSYAISVHDASLLKAIGEERAHEIGHMPVGWLGSNCSKHTDALKMLGWFDALDRGTDIAEVLLHDWSGTLAELRTAALSL